MSVFVEVAPNLRSLAQGISQRTRTEQEMMRILATPRSQESNPYCDLLYGAMEQQGCQAEPFRLASLLEGEYEVWHLHWPEGFFQKNPPIVAALRMVGLLGLVLWARLCGMRVVWTVHNLVAHESTYPALESVFWRAFSGLVHGTISLSRSAQHRAFTTYPALREKPAAVIPHGHYRPVYPRTMDCGDARERLGLKASHRVALYFGAIRPYKEVPDFIRSFGEVKGEDLRLLVIGNPRSEEDKRRVQAAASQDARVHSVLEFIPDERVQVYFQAADVVILPQRSFLNSGSALLSLSFDCPVLAAKKGSIVDLRNRFGWEWVQLFNPPVQSADVARAIEWGSETPRPARAPLDDLAWTPIARQTLDFFERL